MWVENQSVKKMVVKVDEDKRKWEGENPIKKLLFLERQLK